MRAGRYADAERVYREDLAHYPENGWSLFGLSGERFGSRRKTRRRRRWRNASAKSGLARMSRWARPASASPAHPGSCTKDRKSSGPWRITEETCESDGWDYRADRSRKGNWNREDLKDLQGAIAFAIPSTGENPFEVFGVFAVRCFCRRCISARKSWALYRHPPPEEGWISMQ